VVALARTCAADRIAVLPQLLDLVDRRAERLGDLVADLLAHLTFGVTLGLGERRLATGLGAREDVDLLVPARRHLLGEVLLADVLVVLDVAVELGAQPGLGEFLLERLDLLAGTLEAAA